MKEFEITKDNYNYYKELCELKENIYSLPTQMKFLKNWFIISSPLFCLILLALAIPGPVGCMFALISTISLVISSLVGGISYYKTPYNIMKKKYNDIIDIDYDILKEELEKVREKQKDKITTYESKNLEEENLEEILDNEFYAYKRKEKEKIKEDILISIKGKETLKNVIENNKFYYEIPEENLVDTNEIEKVKCKIRKMNNRK